jgi:GntR family transcriptional regulator / MocR family aminotransferase
MHLVARLKRRLSDVATERKAFERGVVARAMSRLYIDAPAKSALLLGFSGYPRHAIPTAVARLAQGVRDRSTHTKT